MTGRIANEADIWKLDHPVWYALSEAHREFALDYGGVRFYQPDYCPFGDFISSDNIQLGLEEYGRRCGFFHLFDEPHTVREPLRIVSSLLCRQMVLNESVEIPIDELIVPLEINHATSLSALVNLVQPGYFRKRTYELGRYYGIFKDGKLVAVTGERMQLDTCIEVSAVVTHPDYTRRGYARQLIAHTVRQILLDGKLPFLHVAADNLGAIRLYEKLGFRSRRNLMLWKLECQPGR